ncbi:hypothetical protein [Cystobacter fuscus]|uniref:hypothetical protein n=1 Tax=Cystobacter fuscus TaxID=43 RepID=UPI0012DCF179|nr:hypothetical protein [Cystobacter fuscus]
MQKNDARSGQADVVDHTGMEAIQMKSVTGTSLNTFLGNLQSAVEQLGGAGEPTTLIACNPKTPRPGSCESSTSTEPTPSRPAN